MISPEEAYLKMLEWRALELEREVRMVEEFRGLQWCAQAEEILRQCQLDLIKLTQLLNEARGWQST